MKKIHIILLVLIAGSIGILLTFLKTTSTYENIETAISKPGKTVHLIVQLDKSQPIEYDQKKDPNFLSFTAKDSTGKSLKVIYHDGKPENLEMSDKLVLKGKYQNGLFDCTGIQTKCPSKYKDEQAKGGTHPGNVPTK